MRRPVGARHRAATAPTSVFSSVTVVAGEKLCLLRFPEGHVLAGSLPRPEDPGGASSSPCCVVTVSYLMLLRFIRQKSMRSMQPGNPRSDGPRVTRSVTIVVLSFFLCWMPNQAHDSCGACSSSSTWCRSTGTRPSTWCPGVRLPADRVPGAHQQLPQPHHLLPHEEGVQEETEGLNISGMRDEPVLNNNNNDRPKTVPNIKQGAPGAHGAKRAPVMKRVDCIKYNTLLRY